MDLQLQGRTCLVTGASAGIGAGIARCIANEGARVAITARRRDLLTEVAKGISQTGAAAPVVIVGDVATLSGPQKIAKAAVEALGSIEVLVNAAGGSRTLTLESGEAAWAETFELNFSSARRFGELLVPSMKVRNWGRVINITGSMEPRTLNGAVAAKAALHMWAKGLSCDVAPYGITVNCIAPGRINSEQILHKLHPTEKARDEFIARNIPIGYFGEPDDLACLATFLASPLARYITGAVIPVDGGMHAFGH